MISLLAVLIFTTLDSRLIKADSLFESGNYFVAESIYLEVLKHADDLNKSICLKGLGNVSFFYGRFEKASDYYSQSLEIFIRINDRMGQVKLRNNLGALYSFTGDYENAINSFSKAQEIFREFDDHKGVAVSMQNIGAVYMRYGKIDISYYDSALFYYGIAEKLVKDKADRANLYNNIGILYEKLNDYENAHNKYKRALKLSDEINDSLNIAKSCNNIGNVHFVKGNYKEALNFYQRALLIIEKSGYGIWAASVFSNLGFAQYNAGNIDEALTTLASSIKIIENLRGTIASQEFRSIYFENKVIIYEEIVDIYCKKENAKLAFNYAERAKARAFLDLVTQVDLSKGKSITPETKILIKKEQDLARRIEYLTGDKMQIEAIIEHNEVLKELGKEFPEYNSLKSIEPIRINALQSALDTQTAVVEYFIGPRYGYVFVITKNNLSIKKLAKKPLEIHRVVDSLIQWVRRREDFSKYGKWLYTCLLQPVASEFTDKTRLCIIPHGALYYLPFSVLVTDDKEEKLLIEEYDIFYSSSASIYGIAHKKNKKRKERVLILAKSDFSEHPDWFDLPLPGTNAEKDSIIAANVFENVNVFSDVDTSLPPPTETNLKKKFKEFDIIHLATHGKLDNDAPLDSRIVLSADDKNDGNLSVREIFNLSLNGYLVTLSACETGKLKGFDVLGKYSLGDDIVSLTRAFIYAGTPSVVTSLWKVHDVSTALLMVQFYKNLKSADKVKALCEAQRRLMKSKELHYFNKPFYWAPFVVFGDWQ